MKRNNYVIIGVTGGVGAGKSTVLSVLRQKYQAQLLLADDIAKELMRPGQASYEALVREFGTKILAEDQTLDTQKMTKLVFADETANAKVNALVHPIVATEIKKRVSDILKKNDTNAGGLSLIVIEAALLIEGGLAPLCDRLWYVYASEELRIQRLIKSRGYSEEKCRSIMKHQKTEEEFCTCCTDIIHTCGDFSNTEAIIEEHVGVIASLYKNSGCATND